MNEQGAVGGASPVLSIKGLAVEFYSGNRWIRVVDGVDLEVAPGETVGLVGESGSGKTVTSLAVMGLLPPRTSRVGGEIFVNGRDVLTMSQRELADLRGTGMAMVFQEPRRSLNPTFTVGDQISEVLRRHNGLSRKAAWTRAVEMLEAVGIPDPAKRAKAYPHQFSGGMCQRVMLAIALACQPKLLIADEPTTALDVTVQKEMLGLMNQLQADFGVGILFITHDLGVVAEMCDRVSVMYAGQVVESTLMPKLFHEPRHPYSAGLIAAIPDSAAESGRFMAIGGSVPAPQDWPTGCRFAARCNHRTEQCTDTPVTMSRTEADGLVRCVRAHQLSLEGAPA